jgi:hypothetical protein
VASVEAGEQGAEAEITLPASAPPTEEPVIPGVEPTHEVWVDNPKAEGQVALLSREEMAALPAALTIHPPQGSYQNHTLAYVLAQGDVSDEWLGYALRQPWPLDQDFKAALTLAVKAHRPEMYAAWRSEA